MEIWAKSDGETLKEHTEKVKEEIKKLIIQISSSYLPSYGLLNEILNNENIKKEFVKLLKLVAIYHDLGKISPKFQFEIVHNPDFSKNDALEFPDVPHSFLSPAFFNIEKIKEFENIINFLKCDNRDLLKIVLSTIAFHHWRENYTEKFLNNWEHIHKSIEKLKNNKELLSNLMEIDENIPLETINSYYNKLLIPPDNLVFLVKELEQELSKRQKNFFILLKGFLHRADHFASSNLEHKIEIEPLEPVEAENRIIKEIKRRAEEKYGIKIKDIWQLKKVKCTENKNIFLKATTGVGKTEFALFWSKGKKLIYVLPIRTAVNAMWKRLKNIFGDDKVGLLHSDALFYLEDIRDHKRDESISESFLSYDLAKNLSYPVIVATADQFFVSGLKYPGYEKIYSTLAYSYIVIDEIQLYDPHISAIILKTLEEIVELGGKFCIMSATLPDFYKEKMAERGINFETIEHMPKKHKNLKKHKIKLENKGIIISENKEKSDKICNPELINQIKTYLEDGKKILIVLNTIEAAKIVYENLKDNFKDINCMLLHSQFTLNDRKEKEERFEDEKNKNLPDILVATQVAETSLDIDYDVLFTELAPLDSLFQRMGRVLRRYRENFEYKEEKPNVLIFGIIKDKKEIKDVSGVGTVYRKDVLFETYKLIKQKDGKLISEAEKINLINKFYENLKNDKNYFDEFENMLGILDSLFSAESKQKAQEIFRNIIQISGIPANKMDEFKENFRKISSEMKDLLSNYDKFYKNWLEEYKRADTGREELKKELKNKLKEFKEKRRKISSEAFKILANSLVHLYPSKDLKKVPLIYKIKELEENDYKEKRLQKWLTNLFEGIYFFENVRYNSNLGAIVEIERDQLIL